MSMKLWGGRFATGSDQLFEQFSSSLGFDQRLLEADVVGSKAFASALEKVDILSSDERDCIRTACDEILKESQAPNYFDNVDDEDIHTFVIRKLAEKVGELAEKIHTGRSRNEQVATDLRIWLREEIRDDRVRLTEIMQSLLSFARREPSAVLPGYTHLRRAQPVLWAHYLLAYFEMFERDWERLGIAFDRTNVLPLGSGALAGSGFPFDRQEMAEELGFASISRNSLDAISDRDFAIDFLHAASVTMLHLSRLAEDWIIYSSEEFSFIELDDKITSGSSLMPQKKNPDAFELVRGKVGPVVGNLTALMMTMKGLPLAYNRDLQEDKIPVFDAADHLAGSLEITRLSIDTATINTAAMETAANESWSCATELAEVLARNGVPFHRAHQIVGTLVLESLRVKKQPQDWTAEQLQYIAPEFGTDAVEFLSAKKALENHKLPGGTAPSVVLKSLEQAEERLANMRDEQT